MEHTYGQRSTVRRRRLALWMSLSLGAAVLTMRLALITGSATVTMTIIGVYVTILAVILGVINWRTRLQIRGQMASRFVDVPGQLDVGCLPEPWPRWAMETRPRGTAHLPTLPIRLRTVPDRIVLEKDDHRATAQPFRAELPASAVVNIVVTPLGWRSSTLAFPLTSGRIVRIDMPVRPDDATRLAQVIRNGIGSPPLAPGDIAIVTAPPRSKAPHRIG